MAETIDSQQQRIIDGLEGSLPGVEGFSFAPGDRRILGWLREALDEGDQIIKDDPMYKSIESLMDYVLGMQSLGPRPSYLPAITANRMRKAVRTHASALTDIRPLFQFKTQNPAFDEHAQLLNKYIVAWWVNTAADQSLANAIKYASAAGCSDISVEHDPFSRGGPDTRLIARDPRDTIPIRPSRTDSIQDWEGVILREAVTINKLKTMFPEYGPQFRPDKANMFGQVFTRYKRTMNLVSPSSPIDALRNTERSKRAMPETILYRVYLKDRSINLSGSDKLMGKAGTNWCYMVKPGEPLYPRGRLILCTEDLVLSDGPNPYWHGMFPVVRLKLESWPWLFLGMPLCYDLKQLQDGINIFINHVFTNFSQHVNPAIVADKNAVPESQLKRFDPRRPNSKLRLNPTMGEGFKMLEAPQLPAYTMEFGKALIDMFDDLAETANLQQLLQLRQMPGADTIESFYRSLTPGLKMEGRLVELALREVAEMAKMNIFQFQSMARRIMVLGEAGKTLSDFDFDPQTMIPAMQPTDKGYTPELDSNRPRDQRAQFMNRVLTFYVAPNSILAIHAQEEQMKYLQLSRQGYLDVWTLMEMMEVPNFGSPPPIPLPPKDYQPTVDPVTGVPKPPPLEIRVPTTVTERLQCQQQLGIGQTVSPAGRKSSGQAPPKAAQKAGGRTTIKESR